MEISDKMLQSCKEFADNPISDGGLKWKPNSGPIKTSFELQSRLRLYVMCDHVYHKGIFIVTCHNINIEQMELKAQTALEAANEAVEIVRTKAWSILGSLTPKK